MKPALLILSLVLLVGCNPKETGMASLSKFEEKHEPFDHFYFQRAYPDNRVNYREMEKSLQTARKWAEKRQKKVVDGEWVQEGPLNIGGRINCVAIHPFDNDIIYTGTAGGGIFRTDDGGDSWEPITDDLSHLPIGHIAIDPVNPDVLYAGTGDVNISGNVWIGNGIYKSTDAGASWEYLGLEECRIISKIVINPDNTNQIFAGAMGVPFEANNDRGLYRSNDGGNTWEQVLFVSDDSGVIDLIMNPDNPSVLYAANFNRIRTAFESIASGEEGGIYKSTDGGETWVELTNGLPSGPTSRIGLHLWEGNPDVVFAQYVNTDFQLQGIYKSTNAGASFSEINTFGIPANALGGFGWYFGKIAVSPWNQNEISLLGVDLYTTFNNGQTWQLAAPEWWEYIVHADKHVLEYLGPNEVILATDGGLYRTEDGFQTWSDIDRIPNTQFYRITSNPHEPGMVLGGAQDNGTSVGFLGEPNADWLRFWGGDGFTPIVDPVDETLVYTTTQYGTFYYIYTDFADLNIWDYLISGLDGLERVNWDAPFIMDPTDNTTLYTGTERIYRMEGAPFGFWEPISPVLVLPDEEFYDRRNVSALAASSLNDELLYAGTTDGQVWVSTNDGANWENVSAALPERYVTDIKASPFDEGTVFVSLSGYRDNSETPHLFRSQDYGQTWADITGDLPEMPVNHVEIYDPSIYFIATDNGVYYTLNGGVNWDRMGTNLPNVVVLDLHINPDLNMLLAGTYARSMWSFDLTGFVLPTSVQTPNLKPRKLKLYPNPVAETLFIENEQSGIRDWAIYSSDGRLVATYHNATSEGAQPISVTYLPNGTYVIAGLNAEGEIVESRRFVVE